MGTIIDTDPKKPQTIEGNPVAYYWEEGGTRYSVTASTSTFGASELPGGAPVIFQVYNPDGRINTEQTIKFQKAYEFGEQGAVYRGIANSVLPLAGSVYDYFTGNTLSQAINRVLPTNSQKIPEVPNPFTMASKALEPGANATSEERFAYNAGWWTGVGIQAVAAAPDTIALLRQAPKLLARLVTRSAADTQSLLDVMYAKPVEPPASVPALPSVTTAVPEPPPTTVAPEPPSSPVIQPRPAPATSGPSFPDGVTAGPVKLPGGQSFLDVINPQPPAVSVPTAPPETIAVPQPPSIVVAAEEPPPTVTYYPRPEASPAQAVPQTGSTLRPNPTLFEQQAQELEAARAWYAKTQAGSFPRNPEEIQSVLFSYRIAQARLRAVSDPNYTLDQFTRDSMRLNGENAPNHIGDLAPPMPEPAAVGREALLQPTRAEIQQARTDYLLKGGVRVPPKPGTPEELEMVQQYWARMARDDFKARFPDRVPPRPHTAEENRLINTYRRQQLVKGQKPEPVQAPKPSTDPAPQPEPISNPASQTIGGAKSMVQSVVTKIRNSKFLSYGAVGVGTAGALASVLVVLPASTTPSSAAPASASKLVSPPGGIQPPKHPLTPIVINAKDPPAGASPPAVASGGPPATKPGAPAPSTAAHAPKPKPRHAAAHRHHAALRDRDEGPIDPNDPSEALNREELARIQRTQGSAPARAPVPQAAQHGNYGDMKTDPDLAAKRYAPYSNGVGPNPGGVQRATRSHKGQGIGYWMGQNPNG